MSLISFYIVIYDRLRDLMFRQVKDNTGYDLESMKDNNEWLFDVLIGHGLPSKVVREKIGKAVASVLVAAMRVRKRPEARITCFVCGQVASSLQLHCSYIAVTLQLHCSYIA